MIPPEPKEGETEEKSWRNKAKRFVMDRYPELVEFPDLQYMFFSLKTTVCIDNQSLTEMMIINAFRWKAWWSEEEVVMTDVSSFRTKLKIKNTELNELVKKKNS